MADGWRPERWNLLRVALYGAVGGVALAMLNMMTGGSSGGGVSFSVGYLIGGAVCGAVLAGLFAGLRNMLLRAR